MSSVLSSKDEKVIGSESTGAGAANRTSAASSSSGGGGKTAATSAKEDDICDNWEQLDQQVNRCVWIKIAAFEKS